jgi:alcohol dehydrogenase
MKMSHYLATKSSYDIDRIFEFQATGLFSPTRVIFGCNSVDRIAEEAGKYRSGNILFITSKPHDELGVVDRIKRALSTKENSVFVFSDVEAEPSIATADKIYAEYIGKDISLLVGFGGGSVMDICKLLSPCFHGRHLPESMARGQIVTHARGVPFFLVPTTSGTGSEVTPFFVVSDVNGKLLQNSPNYYPELTFVDPQVMVSMPPKLTAITGMDALSHAIEGMMNLKANPFSDMLCLGAVELLGVFLDRAVQSGDDLEARFYVALASTMAQLGMVMSGATYAHSVTYIIAKYKATPHGLGCALGLPYIMAYNAEAASIKLASIAEALGGSIITLTDQQAAKLAPVLVKDLMQTVGLPVSLKEYGGISEEDLEEAGRLMIELYPRPMNPRPMSIAESIQYWRDMYEGKL